MTNNSAAIQFLENDDLRALIQALHPEQLTNQPWSSLQGPKFTETQSGLSIYKSLASEYERFLQEDYLDNIYLVVSGIDNKLFSSASGELLITEARHRLDSPLFGDRLVITESESVLDVLWFPPIPTKHIYLGCKSEGMVKDNLIRYFNNELGLMISEISLSFITDGHGWEQFFYERYFLPKKFVEITGIDALTQQAPFSKGEKEIISYVLEGQTDLLKSLVNEQLPEPLRFDVQLPEPFIPSEASALFMPFIRIGMNAVPGTAVDVVIHSVAQKLEVLEYTEMDGRLTLHCMAPEGPYAETVSDILVNIHEHLGPPVTQFLNSIDLGPYELTFILTHIEH